MAGRISAALDVTDPEPLPPGHPYRRYMPDNLWPTQVEGFREYLGGLDDILRVIRALRVGGPGTQRRERGGGCGRRAPCAACPRGPSGAACRR